MNNLETTLFGRRHNACDTLQLAQWKNTRLLLGLELKHFIIIRKSLYNSMEDLWSNLNLL